MKIINIATFEAFDQLYQKYEKTKGIEDEFKSLLLFFVASDDVQTKESWCSDCRACKETMNKTIDNFQYNDQLALAVIQVGQREEWKSPDNPFRLHRLQVTAVPTLLSLKLGQRLVEGECADPAQVSHLFSNSI